MGRLCGAVEVDNNNFKDAHLQIRQLGKSLFLFLMEWNENS
jgi:hypothetical protein